MKIKGKSIPRKKLFKTLWLKLALFLIYIGLLIMLPLFAIFDLRELLPCVSLIYQILGIYLLYTDEKYKMNRVSMKYGKANTFWISFFYAPRDIFRLFKQIYHYPKNPNESDSTLFSDVKVTHINHEYEKIEDQKEMEEARIISFEYDLQMLRYFSEVRKGGYIIIGIGFFLQFLTFFVVRN